MFNRAKIERVSNLQPQKPGQCYFKLHTLGTTFSLEEPARSRQPTAPLALLASSRWSKFGELSRQIYAVPDLCCIVSRRLVELVGGVFDPCYGHAASLIWMQQSLGVTELHAKEYCLKVAPIFSFWECVAPKKEMNKEKIVSVSAPA